MDALLQRIVSALLFAAILLGTAGGWANGLWLWSSRTTVRGIRLHIEVETRHRHTVCLELRTWDHQHRD
jgi:hypothetical protein